VPSFQPIFMSILWPTLLAAIGVCTLMVSKESVSRAPSRPRIGMDWERRARRTWTAPSTGHLYVCVCVCMCAGRGVGVGG